MSVTPEEIKKVAHLARLSLPDEQLESYVQDCNQILQLVAQLQQADTQGVAPMASLPNSTLTAREDQVSEPTDPEEKLAARERNLSNAPKKEAGLFLVPKVVE